MSSTQLSRLYYLACELKPALPEDTIGRYIGKSYWPLIKAGAAFGLAGTAAAVAGTSADVISEFYMQGAETGLEPTIDEFMAGLGGMIFEAITAKSDLSSLEQMRLITKLNAFIDGGHSYNGDGAMDFDAVVPTPMFTKTGFWPLDNICGVDGCPQDVVTLLAKPEAGKTRTALSVIHSWRRLDIGPVVLIQSEMSASAMSHVVRSMSRADEKLFRSGVDQMIFGKRGAEQWLKQLQDNPDPDRLVVFDSIGGHCGQGDTPDSRNRFAELYMNLMAVKNASRLVLACGHVKRGEDMYNIESAAGSSAIERFSGVLAFITKDPEPWPGGRSSIRIETSKNRWHPRVRPFDYIYDYKSGEAFDERHDDGEDLDGEDE